MAKDDKKIGSGKGDQLIADQHGKGQQQKGGTAARINEHEPSPTKTAQEEIEDQLFDLKYDIGCARRYNVFMASKYEKWEQLSVIVSLIGGSAVFAEAIKSVDRVALVASLIILFVTTSSMVLKWSDKARQHDALYKQYTTLFERISRHGSRITMDDIEDLWADFYLIEASETKIDYNRMTLCERDECARLGAETKKLDAKIEGWGFFKKVAVHFPHPF